MVSRTMCCQMAELLVMAAPLASFMIRLRKTVYSAEIQAPSSEMSIPPVSTSSGELRMKESVWIILTMHQKK